MKKRRVTVTISGHRCSFYSDDSDAYLAALEQRANDVMKQTAQFSGRSAYTNAILSVVFLTDRMMRAEQKKNPEKPVEHRQISIWDLLDGQK